ncbi:DUF6193 family natural product biosynthesis protein [Streptomyces sp. DSM 41014]|uniref:DUF6193 family natural product biosynthesis protein n=1 Tax=Streptomyces hintoniae TaxID=3075521 RepID=A0ABU2UT30_9ACTN|nr:DUF6193 family natural product biosynthesis protein [Streptomyces sp. DSM 41014]MDT0475977.1 DUF6193 family natural product biosynthesis protein [Streptomyces sp. DSM 41014]
MTSDTAPPGRQEPLRADASLYPDLASAGSFAGALETVAAELGLSLGRILVDGSDPYRSAGVENTVADRDVCWISLGSVDRWFFFSGWSRGVQLVSGATQDLGEMARALEAWRNGLRLKEIREVSPFVEVTELAEAHEKGPAEAVAVKWRLLLEDLRQESERLELARRTLKVAELAHAEPQLRRLLPLTSHWSLHFSTCTGFPYSWDVPFIDPMSDGRYRVCGPSRGTVIGETETAEHAITLVIAGLPANCGPAVAGTAGDQQLF